jgi:RNA polymerase sigma factor (sigma-70 family)
METADLAQESMIHIIQNAPGCHFETESDFLCWIRCIVENRVRSATRYWQAAGRGHECRHLSTAQLTDARAPRPSESFFRKEDAKGLLIALDSLSNVDRDVILSRLFLELPWAAVAKSVGTSVAAAQMRFTRARRRLMKLWGPE